MIDELTALQHLIDPDEPADVDHDLYGNPWGLLPVLYPSVLDEVSADVAERAILLTLAQVHREQPDGEDPLDHIPAAYMPTLHSNIYRVLGIRRSMDELSTVPMPRVSRAWRLAPEFVNFAGAPG